MRRRTSSASIANCRWCSGPSRNKAPMPCGTAANASARRRAAESHASAAVMSRGPRWRNLRSAWGATRRRSSSAAIPVRRRRSPSCANTSATSSSSPATPRQIRNARSSDVSMSRGTSVSAARSNPGSTSASSGNSRSSDRQNASIVEIAMSPRRSFKPRHRSPSIDDSRLASTSRSMIRSRISAAAFRVNVIARM